MTGTGGHTGAWIDRIATRLAAAHPSRLNRRSLATIGLTTTALAAIGHDPVARAKTSRDLIQVLDDCTSAEGLMITLLAVVRTKASDMELDDSTIRIIRAAQCEDGAHFDNLVARGGSPSTVRYTFLDEIFTNGEKWLATWSQLTEIMQGMYLSAARQAADGGNGDLVEIMFQIGAVESQYVALIRQLQGERIPANRAFPAWQFANVTEALAALRNAGFIDGPGTAYDYPGPGDRYCRGVTGLVAETTSDQTPPDITAAPRPSATESVATPAASPAGE